jgi:hypothetical protein
MNAKADDWIGTAEVAAELRLTERAAWEVLRGAGIRMLNPRRMGMARFRRSDWEAAREAILKPPAPRAPYVRPAAPAAAAVKAPPKPTGGAVAEKMARLRKG